MKQHADHETVEARIDTSERDMIEMSNGAEYYDLSSTLVGGGFR